MKLERKNMCLYAVTDRSWVGEKSFLEQLEDSLKGGVTLLQLREKNLSREEFLKEAQEVKKLTDKYGVPLIINDDVEIALLADAAGVHVGQKDMEAGEARKKLGADKILGVSCRTVEAAKSRANGSRLSGGRSDVCNLHKDRGRGDYKGTPDVYLPGGFYSGCGNRRN